MGWEYSMPVQNTATDFTKTASNTTARQEIKTSQEALMGFITNLQVWLCEMQCNNSTWSEHFQLCERAARLQKSNGISKSQFDKNWSVISSMIQIRIAQ